jgi:prepilin-type processing-associated H-X9-DG protein
MHNEHDRFNGFYAPLAHDADGNLVTADLSFRVSLLPFVENDSLYRQFDLTQGWDSPRNRPHSNTVVMPYRSPYATDQATTNTPYRAFVGGGALFNENGTPVRITQIRDGSAFTIMLMAVEDEVPWAAPREIKYSPTGPLPKIGSKAVPAGANVLMADGSVKFLKSTTTEQVFRALITRDGGETLPPDW